MKKIIYMFLFSLFFKFLKANVIEFKGKKLEIAKEAKLLGDPDGSLCISEVSKKEFITSPKHKFFVINGKSKHNWIKISIINRSDSEIIFVSGWFTNVRSVEIYSNENNNPKGKKLSNSHTIGGMKIGSVDQSATLKLEKNKKRTFYILVKSRPNGENIKTNLYLSTPEEQIGLPAKWSSLDSLKDFINLLIVLLVYATYVYFKDRYLLSFGLFFLVDVLYSLYTSYAVNPDYNVQIIIAALSVTLHLKFMRDILKSRTTWPLFNNMTYIVNISHIMVSMLIMYYDILYKNVPSLAKDINSLVVLMDHFLYLVTILVFLRNQSRKILQSFWGALVSSSIFLFTIRLLQEAEIIINLAIVPFNPKWTGLFGDIENIGAAFLLLADRLSMLRTDYAVSKNAGKFVTSLRKSGRMSEIFTHLLSDMKSNLDFDSALLFVKNDGEMHLETTFPESNLIDESFTKEIIRLAGDKDIYICNDIRKEPSLPKYPGVESILLVKMSFMNTHYGSTIFLSMKHEDFRENKLGFAKDYAQKGAMLIEHFMKAKLFNDKEKALQIAENMRIFQKGTTHEISIPLFAQRDQIYSLSRWYKETHKEKDSKIEELIRDIEHSNRSSLEQIEESLSLVGAEVEKEFTLQYLYDQMSSLRKLCMINNIKMEESFRIPMDEKIVAPQKSLKNLLNMVIKSSIEAFESMEEGEKSKRISLVIYRENNKLKVNVRDNGPGIKKDSLDKAFHLFSEGKLSSHSANLGQGLLLAKATAEQLGGKIEIDSVEGAFTQVSFSIEAFKNE